MVSFHAPLIGFVISKDLNRKNVFTLKAVDILSDLDSLDDLDIEIISESLKRVVDPNKAILLMFFEWLIDNRNSFSLDKKYHGGSMLTLLL